MKTSLSILFLSAVSVAATNCHWKEVAFEQKVDFSSGQATVDFPLNADRARHRILLTVEEQFGFTSVYRVGATLSTPSMQMKETEVSAAPGKDEAPQQTGGGAVSGTTRIRTDQYTLFDFDSEKGSYRLAVYSLEQAPRAQFRSATIRVEKY